MIVDWFSLVLLSLFAFKGFLNGFSKELSSTFSWVVSLIVAWYFGPFLLPFFDPLIPNDQVKTFVTFLALFLIVLISLKALISIFSKFLNFIGLGFLDKISGFVFGTFKATLLLLSLYLLALDFLEDKSWWVNSHSEYFTFKISRVVEPLLREWGHEAEVFLKKEKIGSLPSL